jgi:outer membrane protein W
VRRARGVVALAFAAAVGLPAPGAATEAPWSVGISGGYFAPATENWEQNYDKRGGLLPSLSAGYTVIDGVSVTAEAAYFSAESQARDVTGQLSIDRQRLRLIPVTLALEYRLRLGDQQLVVPFVGGGYRRVAYRLTVGDNDDVTGGAGGPVARGGIDVLLNRLDPSAASGLAEDYGVTGTYLRLEAQWAKAEASGTTGEDIDLGGVTYLVGLRFEF